jgi:5-methylcytosine-specific restriction endonuclease McrA
MSSTPEYNRKYYLKNRKRVLARNKAWNAANTEAMLRISKEWTKNNPEEAIERFRKYFKNHKEECNKRCRDYQKRNLKLFKAKNQKRRTAKTQAGGSFTAAEWTALCARYHNRCLDCCKRRKLTADHVVPVSKGGSSNISNIQPLCGPCNSSKGAKSTDYRERGTHGKRAAGA